MLGLSAVQIILGIINVIKIYRESNLKSGNIHKFKQFHMYIGYFMMFASYVSMITGYVLHFKDIL